MEVDILVNKYLEILNSQLIGKYCELDKRFREAALVLKHWMKLTDPDKSNRLNSFSVYMILLAYMIHKKYLPNLQQQKGSERQILTYEIQCKAKFRSRIPW